MPHKHIEGPARYCGLAPDTPELAPWNISRIAASITRGTAE